MKNFWEDKMTDEQLDKVSGGTKSEIIALADAMRIATEYRVDEKGKLHPGLEQIVKGQLEMAYGFSKVNLYNDSKKNEYKVGNTCVIHKDVMDMIRGKKTIEK